MRLILSLFGHILLVEYATEIAIASAVHIGLLQQRQPVLQGVVILPFIGRERFDAIDQQTVSVWRRDSARPCGLR